jgi:hypothetical protein
MRKNIIKEIKKFFEQIKYMIIWFPVIWKDCNWDHSYFLEILRFKMNQMLLYFEKDTIICKEEANEIIKDLSRCLYLIDKLNNGKYEEEAWTDYNKKYPLEEDWGYKFVEEKENDKKIIKYRYEMNDEQKECVIQCKKNEEELYNQYSKELFDIIQRKLRYWWD